MPGDSVGDQFAVSVFSTKFFEDVLLKPLFVRRGVPEKIRAVMV